MPVPTDPRIGSCPVSGYRGHVAGVALRWFGTAAVHLCKPYLTGEKGRTKAELIEGRG